MRKGYKDFTLLDLFVMTAIIGLLVNKSISIFNHQLRKAGVALN